MKRLLVSVLASFLACASAPACAGWMLGQELRDFAWIDSDAQPLRLSTLRAPVIVMTMAYTACRKVCGTTTLVLNDIQRRFDAMKIEADFVVVSYDPANDGPAEWRDYRARRQLTRNNWHFLTGNPTITRKIGRRLDLDFWNYHDHIVHDFRIVLFDAQWRALTEVDWDHIDRVDEILARLPASSMPANSTD
ncbi:MAG TPA: SCO family protein [Burkholderiaceae bacterium]|nr:SCO family protein [Burkholderiaceae bacterium]